MNSPPWIADLTQFARDHAGWAITLAGVLNAWILASSKRKIVLTMKDGTTVSAEGVSAKSFATVMKQTAATLKPETRLPLSKREKAKRGSAVS